MNAPQGFCHSCGMPAEETYCQYCTDESGKLKARDEIRQGIAEWLSSWGPDEGADYGSRADLYMKAMPAWAQK